MALPPAGWYDDPEAPSQYRYWDGTVWTEHRAPKTTPVRPRDNSAFGIVTWGWTLLGKAKATLAVIGATVFAIMIAGMVVAAIALASALEPDLFDIVDRMTDPGWDPVNDPDDEAYLDAIEFDPSIGSLTVAVVAGLAVYLATGLGAATGMLYLAAVNAGTVRPGTACFSLALRRTPRWIGILLLWGLLLMALSTAGLLLILLAIAIAPILLLVAIPVVVAAVIFVWPYLHMAFPTLILAPRDDPPLRRTITMVSADWGGVAGRVLLLNLVLFAIAIGGGIVGLIPLLGIFVALAITAIQYGLAMATSVALYEFAGGPLDPEITSTMESTATPSG